MIDWWSIGTNSLWILGLSILLAVFSYLDWLARETRRPRRSLFNERSLRLPWTAGMFLACVGWGLSQAERWWEQGLWLMLAAWFVGETVRLIAPSCRRS